MWTWATETKKINNETKHCEYTLPLPFLLFPYLDRKPKYSIILSNNKNIRWGHTLLSRKSFKRIKEWKLKKKTKEQNKTGENTQNLLKKINSVHITIYRNNDNSHQWFQQIASFFTPILLLSNLIWDASSLLWPKSL